MEIFCDSNHLTLTLQMISSALHAERTTVYKSVTVDLRLLSVISHDWNNVQFKQRVTLVPLYTSADPIFTHPASLC